MTVPVWIISSSSAALIGGIIWWLLSFERLPDFSEYTVVTEKKAAFFDYLTPKVHKVNAMIEGDRARVIAVRQQMVDGTLQWYQRAQLVSIAHRYRFYPDQDTSDEMLVNQLLQRVNTIPLGLALVQAAKESGWGTSKFARQANNLFGQQCFTKGCGIVPSKRSPGRTHEVTRFASVDDAIASYALNLNSHPRYLELRNIRAELTETGQPVSSRALADGLLAYSERGADYVREIKAMLRRNKLP